MAKMMYEDKRVLTVCGILKKTESGEFVIVVENKDNAMTYNVNNVLNSLTGQIVRIDGESLYDDNNKQHLISLMMRVIFNTNFDYAMPNLQFDG